MSPPRTRLVLVTGMSGAGRSTALRALEDLGFEAVDNLPLGLLERVAPPPLLDSPTSRPTAIGMDIRSRDFSAAAFRGAISGLRALGIPTLTVFLDCDDAVLIGRFTETRRRHPLAQDRPVSDGIALERASLAPLREIADAVIDTSALTVWDLKRRMAELAGADTATGPVVTVMSFAYRNGLPREADLIFDVRFLTNPHYDPALRALTGRDAPVQAAIEADADFAPFLERLTALLDLTVPRYSREGKSYLTIAFGCTGGRHRSVFLAETVAARLRGIFASVRVKHRELDGAEALLATTGKGQA